MERKRLRLEQARRRQQYERDTCLILYVDRSKYIWDFNNTAHFMVLNSWFFGIWVSMRYAAIRDGDGAFNGMTPFSVMVVMEQRC
jgi:hypothetical protein